MSTTAAGYGRVARGLHWLMAVLLVVQWFSGEYDDWLGVRNHMSLGVTLMALVLIRLAWRVTHPAPPPPATAPGYERAAARVVHVLWYVLLIAMPLSGILWRQFRAKATSWFGVFDLPIWLTPDPGLASFMKEAHEVLATAMLVLLALHVLAALKHQFIDRDGVMRSMVTGQG